jgi:hypothetical protein
MALRYETILDDSLDLSSGRQRADYIQCGHKRHFALERAAEHF